MTQSSSWYSGNNSLCMLRHTVYIFWYINSLTYIRLHTIMWLKHCHPIKSDGQSLKMQWRGLLWTSSSVLVNLPWKLSVFFRNNYFPAMDSSPQCSVELGFTCVYKKLYTCKSENFHIYCLKRKRKKNDV